MKVSSLTKKVISILNDAKISEKSDAEFLVSIVLGLPRSEVYSDKEVCKKKEKKILTLARKRAKGYPLTLILSSASFYGRDFYVSKHCLSPRPETELLVEWAISDNLNNKTVLDLCTGSGAIGLTILKEAKPKNVVLSDVSTRALKVAKKNLKKLNVSAKIVRSNLFNKIHEKFDVIISNPPYIKNSDFKNLDVEVKCHEPKLALIGGEDGLDFYKRIIEEAPKHLNGGGKVYFEIGINQSKEISKMLEKDFENIIVKKDYAGIDRMIRASVKGE
ncbi:MAG: peptide chain release factor N(5)-glutamine methyltransferase [Clostridia bacterium]|nr:peptide chain release factor N(5)-glutamine methyltransferase [Clostridia bacterium]